MTITYNNLIAALDERFPQFAAYLGELRPSISDNVSIYFTFFSVYLKEYWEDEQVHQQLAVLLHQMQASVEEATRIILHDFLLDVCSSCKEHDKDLHVLAQQLTPELQSQLQQLNEGWLTHACALPRGCC